jgi:hypothetical protein
VVLLQSQFQLNILTVELLENLKVEEYIIHIILGILTSHGLRKEISLFPCCYKTDSLKPSTT